MLDFEFELEFTTLDDLIIAGDILTGPERCWSEMADEPYTDQWSRYD